VILWLFLRLWCCACWLRSHTLDAVSSFTQMLHQLCHLWKYLATCLSISDIEVNWFQWIGFFSQYSHYAKFVGICYRYWSSLLSLRYQLSWMTDWPIVWCISSCVHGFVGAAAPPASEDWLACETSALPFSM